MKMQTIEFTVGLVKVAVSDFAAARAYYKNILGLEEEIAMGEYGWAQYRATNIPIAIYVQGKGGGDDVPGGDTGIHLYVSDIEEVHAELKRRGYNNIGKISTSSDDMLFLCASDPDGNMIKILQDPK